MQMEVLVRADIAEGVPLREARRRRGYNLVAAAAAQLTDGQASVGA
jgi:hypothetical protein